MKSQSGMYRTPRDPGGFPFGYNWRATGTGLFLLVAFNFLDHVPLKQSLLAACDVRRRVGRVVEAFELQYSHLQPNLN